MFAKLFMAILIIALIYFFILPKFRTGKNDKKTQNFVECESCHIFGNIDEMIILNGKYFCKDCIKDKK